MDRVSMCFWIRDIDLGVPVRICYNSFQDSVPVACVQPCWPTGLTGLMAAQPPGKPAPIQFTGNHLGKPMADQRAKLKPVP